jgi:hypothetical protein
MDVEARKAFLNDRLDWPEGDYFFVLEGDIRLRLCEFIDWWTPMLETAIEGKGGSEHNEVAHALQQPGPDPALERQEPQSSGVSIEVVRDPPSIKLNDQTYRVTEEGAALIELLCNNPNIWFSSDEIQKRDPLLSACPRIDRIRNKLPRAIGRFIVTQAGKGYRFTLE